MKKPHIAGVAALLATVGAISYFAGTRSGPAAPAASGPAAAAPKGAAPAAAGIAVEAQPPLAVKLPQSIMTVGSLRSDEAVVLRPEIAGCIVEIGFREGQRVSRGDVLVRLDDSVQKADLERARANLTLSKSKYERAVDLRSKGFISSQATDEAENTFKVAQADAALAQARLAKTEIRAPFGGIIGLRSVSVGDYVKEGQDMVNLEEIDPLKVDFRVPEVFLSQVKSGQVLQITMDALPDRTWPGQVFAINPLVDANGRAIAIRAQVPNADGRLRPGMFARVRLLTSEIRDSMMIPEESIFPVGDDKYVYKVVDGRALRQKVDIGQRREGKVEIVGGLAPQDMVVTAGVVKLRDGAPVRVANAPAPQPPVGKADAVAPRKGNS
ncbi:MAG: efflux RND transporter periplasmic adaptor subunit [Betaproteobacteria bacterium]|nr:efflux RND transporter periplasmic adaptor subunit [Betaproteobacteria bacterium]